MPRLFAPDRPITNEETGKPPPAPSTADAKKIPARGREKVTLEKDNGGGMAVILRKKQSTFFAKKRYQV